MSKQDDFLTIQERLKGLLKNYEQRLIVVADEPGRYSLNTPFVEMYKKEVFFGAAQVNKNYVSYHLMPVYVYPQLLEGISKDLKKHMQGKSCFNFKSLDEALFAELGRLTEKGFEMFKELSKRQDSGVLE